MKQGRQAIDARRSRMLSIIRERQTIRVEELAAQFGVSLMTIRRDLQALEDMGQIDRFYGGASAESGGAMPSSQDAIFLYRRLIGERAAELVRDGDRLFINGSNTALGLLDHVEGMRVSVFTNNGMAVGREYAQGVEITLSGGSLRSGGHILTGDCAMRNLLTQRADKAFLGCSGVSPDGDILCDIPTELGINETMLSHAGEYYILADHTKIGKAGTFASFSLETTGSIITDERADERVLERLRCRGMTVIRVTARDANL